MLQVSTAETKQPAREGRFKSTAHQVRAATYHNTPTGLQIFLPSQRGQTIHGLTGLQAQNELRNKLNFQV